MKPMKTLPMMMISADAHEDQQVAGEHVGEQPDAQRDEAQELREHLERHDQEVCIAPREPAGTQLLEVGPGAVVLDADVVRGEERHERQRERDREVRGRRVERERRDPAPDLCSVSTGSGMYEIRLATQMNTNSDARYGNHVVKIFAGSDARPI